MSPKSRVCRDLDFGEQSVNTTSGKPVNTNNKTLIAELILSTIITYKPAFWVKISQNFYKFFYQPLQTADWLVFQPT
ncbi:hypothetical protein VB713_21695 [Anabaena cylindrica UHCC 0172]|uniref:hypothetical protein n=1 Tax=Anabaena cylindrica TaxID=1165 RepID=UPI002B1FE3E7|nr:hypothetical protein [Anabaena cylindrica]MEA5553556.1 hypothetical protein [Anabaena cylindrica UHCC 0172]